MSVARTKLNTREEARQRLLETGVDPLYAYPPDVTWLFRAWAAEAAADGLEYLCRLAPHYHDEILETWCALSAQPGYRWAWDQARARLEAYIFSGREMPPAFRRFAIVPPPPSKPGPDPEGSRSVMVEYFVRGLEQQGLSREQVNAQYGESFSNKDPGSSLRKVRVNGRDFVRPAFDGQARAVQCEPVRPMVLEVDFDWGDPFAAARALLTSDWPALALIWEFWPERREERVAGWCKEASSDPWLWGEVWALLDHAVYCGWDRPWVLRRFVRDSRPAGRVDSRNKKELRVRLAAVVDQLQKQGLPQSAARECCVAALPESDRSLDASTHSKRFFLGREELEELISLDDF